MKRLFIGIPVSEDIKEKIRPLISKLKETKADLKFVSLENLHFTLKFLGDVDESRIEEIKEKLSSIDVEKFKILIKKVGVFPALERIKVIWVGAESQKMVSLMKKVDHQLNSIKKNDYPEEIPHLTIARVKSGRNKEKLQTLLKEVENNEFGEMLIDKFVLYESQLTPKGPVYSVVREFGLK